MKHNYKFTGIEGDILKHNTRMKLYGTTWSKDELGADKKAIGFIKDIWVKVVPSHGNSNKFGGTDVEESSTNQKITCRILSIKKPSTDMFFVDSRGWKYEFITFYPNYKNRDEWEIKTKITYQEGESL